MFMFVGSQFLVLPTLKFHSLGGSLPPAGAQPFMAAKREIGKAESVQTRSAECRKLKLFLLMFLVSSVSVLL